MSLNPMVSTFILSAALPSTVFKASCVWYTCAEDDCCAVWGVDATALRLLSSAPRPVLAAKACVNSEVELARCTEGRCLILL